MLKNDEGETAVLSLSQALLPSFTNTSLESKKVEESIHDLRNKRPDREGQRASDASPSMVCLSRQSHP